MPAPTLAESFHPGPAIPGQLALSFDAPSNGVETSDEAADSMRPHLATARAVVLEWIRLRGTDGATCDEIEVAHGMSHQTASARLNELSNGKKCAALIYRTDIKRPTRSRRGAYVYRAI